MLVSLRIKNFALVEDLHWSPGSGLVAITGETGAGKSVLIGALQLLLGERAEKSAIRAGAESCVVEAVIEMVDSAELDEWLEEQGAEACVEGQLLLKRSVALVGSGRQFINGSPCTLGTLKALGDRLVDLHGPHDHQSLFSRDAQMKVLDAYAGASGLASDFVWAYRKEKGLEEELERLSGMERDAEMRREMLAHTVREIEESKLIPGEEELLMERLRAAGNSRRLEELSGQLQTVLGGDEGLRGILGEVVRSSRELAKLDALAEGVSAAAEEVATLVANLESDVRHYPARIDSDPATLQELEARADLVQSLKRKYGGTFEAVIERGEDASRELGEIEGRSERLELLGKEIEEAKDVTRKLSKKLSAAREKAVSVLAKEVTEELRDLGFLKAEFGVRLEKLSDVRSCGAELVEFEFAPNPGEPSKALRAIASSGEISRVMLALKSVLAGRDGVPILVFDEIDANVGGEIAAKVGRKMRGLAQSHQVLCITHLPQVASVAHRQFVVKKEFVDGRTCTTVGEFTGEERVGELARMLGDHGSDSALAHARNLLAEQD